MMEISRPEGVRQEMRERKLKSGVNWQRGWEAERPKTRTISSQLHVPAALPLEKKRATMPAEQEVWWALKII
jgi:hypothetical protein